MKIIWEWIDGKKEEIKVIDDETPYEEYSSLYFASEYTWEQSKKLEISNCLNRGLLPVNWAERHPTFFFTGAAKKVTIIMDDDKI